MPLLASLRDAALFLRVPVVSLAESLYHRLQIHYPFGIKIVCDGCHFGLARVWDWQYKGMTKRVRKCNLGTRAEHMFPDKYYPVATTIGLLKTDLKEAIEAFVDWQSSILRPPNKHIEPSQYAGDFAGLIQSLHPLEIPGHSRFAFVSTASHWIAYFNNSGMGTQAATIAPVMAERLHCDAMRVVMIRKGIAGSPYPATMFEYYQLNMTPCRTIYAANDGGRWIFGESGDRLPFEECEKYSEKRVCDRFTPEMLQRLLLHFGLRPFDQDWYNPSNAWILRRTST